MKTGRILLIALFCVLFFTASAFAVDLTNRISIGYNNQLSSGIVGTDSAPGGAYLSNQSVSVKYWATRDIGFEGLFGFMSSEYEDVGGWGLNVAGKFHYNVISEKQMNIYTGGGLGVIPVHYSDGHDDETNTGFLVMGFIGVEFFLQGLPNLAFDMELGFNFLDYDEYRQFGTYGGGFGLIGIRYYF